MIRRKLIIALLALGTVGGFASGFHSMHMRRNACRRHHQQQEELRRMDDGGDHGGPRHYPRKWSEEE